MTWSWVDFVIVFVLGMSIWIGSSRGVIMEFFECLILTLNVLLCSHIYGFLSFVFVTVIHTPPLVASVISYTIFFVFFAVVLWILAGKLEIAANMSSSFAPNRFGGVLFGFLKGILVVWIFLFMFAQIPLSKDSLDLLHGSPMVQAVQSITLAIDTTLQTAGSARAYHAIHPLIEKSVF